MWAVPEPLVWDCPSRLGRNASVQVRQEKARVFCDPRVVSWPPHMNLFLHPLQSHFVSSSAYNVLILKGDALTVNFSATYGQTNIAGIDAINNCVLTMDSDELVLTPTVSSTGDFISMTR